MPNTQSTKPQSHKNDDKRWSSLWGWRIDGWPSETYSWRSKKTQNCRSQRSREPHGGVGVRRATRDH